MTGHDDVLWENSPANKPPVYEWNASKCGRWSITITIVNRVTGIPYKAIYVIDALNLYQHTYCFSYLCSALLSLFSAVIIVQVH